MEQKRYEIRTYGWTGNRPYNFALTRTDDLQTALDYLSPNHYIVDNDFEMVIDELTINIEAIQALAL